MVKKKVKEEFVDLGMFGKWHKESLKEAGVFDYIVLGNFNYEPLDLMVQSYKPTKPKRSLFITTRYIRELIDYKIKYKEWKEEVERATNIIVNL